MPSDTPRRLRRPPLGGGPNPPEVLVNAGLIPDLTPVEVVGGEVAGGTSHPGAGRGSAIAGQYDDLASPAKPQKPAGEHTVFEVKKGNPY
jgi:hypothetical protein